MTSRYQCQGLTKFDVRELTLIQPFKKFIGDKLPEGKGYWSICCEVLDNPLSELNQLVNSGLMTPQQYHGVDYDEGFIEGNATRHPDANFFAGAFAHTIVSEPEFSNATLIYFDTTKTITNELPRLIDILTIVVARDIKDVLIVFNVCLSHRGINYTMEEVLKAVESNVSMRKLVQHEGIRPVGTPISYKGDDRTTMFTMFFTR